MLIFTAVDCIATKKKSTKEASIENRRSPNE